MLIRALYDHFRSVEKRKRRPIMPGAIIPPSRIPQIGSSATSLVFSLVLFFFYYQCLALIQSAQSLYQDTSPWATPSPPQTTRGLLYLLRITAAIGVDRRYAEQTEVGEDVVGDASDALRCHYWASVNVESTSGLPNSTGAT
jgi:hypothetical protein